MLPIKKRIDQSLCTLDIIGEESLDEIGVEAEYTWSNSMIVYRAYQ
jgi:hypothetical protein